MNKAQWRYFALNQFLLGKEFGQLPSEAFEHVSVVKDVWNSVLSTASPIVLTEVEELFVNLLRVPFYNMCVSRDSRVLLMEQLLATVRKTDTDPRKCTQWAPAVISSVVPVNVGSLAVKDGVLYVPEALFKQGVDLDSAIDYAFYLRCWGAVDPSEKHKELVRLLLKIASPQGDVSMSNSAFVSLFEMFRAVKVHPITLTRTVLIVNDLLPAYQKFGGLCWWKNFDRGSVYVLCPKGKADRLVCCSIAADEFSRIVSEDPDVVKKLYVQGDTIKIEGQGV